MAGVKGMSKRPLADILARNELGQKQCRSCSLWLAECEFLTNGRLSDGLQGQCKACDRFRRYGLTRADVNRMLDEQGHKCPICPRQFLTFQDFVVDHAHTCCDINGGRNRCGECTRGLICLRCNVYVLSILEDKALVASANEYLERYSR